MSLSGSLPPDDMKSSSSRLLLGVSVLLLCGASASPVSLSVSPNLQQFFTGDSSVSLSCLHEGRTAEGWTVRGTGPAGDCGPPGSGSGPSCVLSLSGPAAGQFWCEASSGQKSENVSITVLGKGLVLEIPALPVRAGCGVTLRCRRSNGDITAAFFFVGQRRLGSGPELVLQPVRRADEGSYWCSTDRFGRSPLSLLRVTGPPLPHSTTPPPPPLVSGPARPTGSPPPLPQACVSVPRLLCHLLVICPYCACSVLLLLRCCSRKSGGAPPPHLAFLAPPTGSQPAVAMETTQPAELDRVTTEHDF
ncbi:uncharacterized protein LOC106941265 isoform X2 [Poecilia latipinna]|uniref:uncharacterized protein LOC106941265 isoform X2 n=1 Tax=Poecilia latipinna TaxID=48699 RepID=UPI00072DF1FC|nr:PREDICTED: uncharacterized protein LOC106941265 isoform X2 [Poecilia latipinna]